MKGVDALQRIQCRYTCAGVADPVKIGVEINSHFGLGFGELFSASAGPSLALRMTLLHFSVSRAMSAPNSAGEPRRTVLPRSESRAAILGSTSARLISRFRISIV